MDKEVAVLGPTIAEPSALPIKSLEMIAQAMRSFIFDANKHVGGSLSSVEALTALYFGIDARLGPRWLGSPDRDKVVFSKGHACTGLYFALWLKGNLPDTTIEDLLQFGELGSPLARMPVRDLVHGIEMSTGSLGQGLSFANGLALADRRRHGDSQVFAFLGDAECGEGQIWEAASTSARLGLSNVAVLLDANGFGSGIAVPRQPWVRKWKAFGWRVAECDGHDLQEVRDALIECRGSGPYAVILRTTKGNGLSRDVANTNLVGSEVSAEHVPSHSLRDDVREAQQVVNEAEPPSGPSAGDAAPKVWTTVSFDSMAPGSTDHAKTFIKGAEAAVPPDGPLICLSPDAVRNSGLNAVLDRDGSWSWDNERSAIVACDIAEQDTASMAGGIAAGGARPAIFLMEGFVWRMLDAIRESITYPALPVVIVGTSGGVSDPLGPMVQSDSCLSALLSMPNLDCLEAADVNEARFLFEVALRRERPVYLRLPHEAVPVRSTIEEIADRDADDGYWLLVDDPSPEIGLVAAGALTEAARIAAKQLRAQGIRVRLMQVYDHKRFQDAVEHGVQRAIFPAAANVSIHNAPPEVLGRQLPRPSRALGVRGFGAYGRPIEELYAHSGLTAEAISDAALELLGNGF